MPQTASRRTLVALSVGFYVVLVAGMLATLLHRTNGHLSYALDDPYIHLALADQLTHGHYGINAGEASSPSSSLLWPFLLTPFAHTAFHPWLPLLWNVLAGLASAWVLGAAVSEWPGPRDGYDLWHRGIAAVALVLTGNLAGLTLIGMEHGLQVLAAIVCAFGLCRVLAGRPLPMACLVAASLSPWLRYECLALTLAVGLALWGLGRRCAALLMSAIAIVPLGAFSLYLRHLGLPLLPLSVLVKGKVASAHTNHLYMAAHTVAAGLFHVVSETEHWPMVVLCAILAAAAWRERERARRFVLLGAALATALQLLIGRFNWLHRYEVYALIFATVIVLRLLQESMPPRLGWYVMGLVALAAPYAQAVPQTVLSAEDIYAEQYQMHRFATEDYNGNIAVIDLGWVSYRLGDGRSVLDLVGLGSLESARQPDQSLAWMADIVQRHNVGLVMIPPLPDPPQGWTRLGQLCLLRPPVATGRCVEFISTKPDEAAEMQRRFAAFARTLPPQSIAMLP